MPELPEVETVVRGLQDPLTSQRIEEVQVDDERLLRNASPEEFKSEVIHQPISKVERLGKYIVFHLTENLLFAIHLRMTGRLLLCGNEDANTDYRRLQLGLTRHQLVMDDMRRFGTLDLLHSVNEDPLGGIGLEPLGESYT
ncbi:MAG: DNA-formamidopyrimidine glycosylase family protein, partial [Candidatus Bipolaricaulota bacterium]